MLSEKITNQNKILKCVLFLNMAGEKAIEVYYPIIFTEKGNYNDYVQGKCYVMHRVLMLDEILFKQLEWHV